MRQQPEFRHLEIPPYCDTGFLFRLDRDGMLAEAGPLGIDRSPAPLVPLVEANNVKGEVVTDDIQINEGTDGDNGWQNVGGLVNGSAADSAASLPTPASTQAFDTASLSPLTTLATSSAQFADLSQIMQSIPQLTAEQFATISGGDGGGGGDSGDEDGGGGG